MKGAGVISIGGRHPHFVHLWIAIQERKGNTLLKTPFSGTFWNRKNPAFGLNLLPDASCDYCNW